jgi:carbamoyl-phosphate synthase large subunit
MMPKRADLHKILIIGSGPIVIGQGCEFDYSGTQACSVLRAQGYEVILVNSNPATIMTDPDLAQHTYVEPINTQTLERIIELERPDAILSTMGGQTALNCALDLEKHGVLKKYNVELIGASKDAIEKAEDRELFRAAMQVLGLEMARSFVVRSINEALEVTQLLNFPIIIRPSYTLGGSGGGIAYDITDFIQICEHGFALSLNHQLLLEESLLGWKEYELEVVRDSNDTCIIVCTIENLDPMGVHTGDSITVAPAQTLTDVEYQVMRNAAIAILREIGVATGGSNVQFAIHPDTGRMVVIEMNPRVSRSSALASKATGFPIAKVAALLAVGFTLDELQNEITGGVIPAAFEPTLDYVVVKIPRFDFAKFPHIKPRLTTQMQAIGEVMAIGSTFAAAMQKALCSLEIDLTGFDAQLDVAKLSNVAVTAQILNELKYAGPLRLLYVADAIRVGMHLYDIHKYSGIDPWFLDQIATIVSMEKNISQQNLQQVNSSQLLFWKQQGFSDARLAKLMHCSESDVRLLRHKLNVRPKFKRIDSCAAEFPAKTAYLYSTYEGECEALPSNSNKVIVLGSGPNRIGQGVEFDYCCVHVVQALQQANIEAIMINCNPETVSTDYDISDRLYFEALTLESVLDIVDLENPLGVILQLGGQTPLKLAKGLQQYNVTILGTSSETIDLAEDRGCFAKVIAKLKLSQPENATVKDLAAGKVVANTLGYPLMVRPSYVLGGRAMQIVYSDQELEEYLHRAFLVDPHNAVLLDRFLHNAIELDVDVVADGNGNVLIAGIMQHIEPAGVHSGDSAAVMPPHSISQDIQAQLRQQSRALAIELKIIGLMNVQFAIQNDKVYVLEVNPRASRTVPFVSKAVGLPIAKIAVTCMLGNSLELSQSDITMVEGIFAVKQAVFPFIKFKGVDPLLGPEMRSTGEIMAFGKGFAAAYAKSLSAVGVACARVAKGCYVSVNMIDRVEIVKIISKLVNFKCAIYACPETAELLQVSGITCTSVQSSDKVISLFSDGQIDLVISNKGAQCHDNLAQKIRSIAIRNRITVCTTIAGAWAYLQATIYNQSGVGVDSVYKLQDLNTQKLLNKQIEVSNML